MGRCASEPRFARLARQPAVVVEQEGGHCNCLSVAENETMPSTPAQLLGLYLHLARSSGRRGQPQVRDRFLVIAGTIAARMELATIDVHCRQIVLAHNPQHLIRRWPSFAAALDDSDFLHFLKQLQRRYPQEKAEQLLSGLGIEMAAERETFASDGEYAAALLRGM